MKTSATSVVPTNLEARRMRKIVSRVAAWVEPSAPQVTEAKRGDSGSSLRSVRQNCSPASGLRGGKNSKETLTSPGAVAAPDGAALSWPQFWQRNDVVLDMSGLAGTGSAVVMPRTGLAWPVRVALRVTPGAIGEIEVRGAQRFIVPMTATGAGAVDVELPPGVYVGNTKQLTLTWGPAPAAP